MGANIFPNRATMFAGDATCSGEKQLLEEVDATSILRIIHENAFYKETSKTFEITKCWHVNNVSLNAQYDVKKLDLNRINKGEVQDYYAFETIENDEQFLSIITNGIQIGNAKFCLLGDPEKGVVVQKYVDALSTERLASNQKRRLVIYKIVLGKYLKVSEEISNMKKEPSKFFDSHISENIEADLTGKDHNEIFQTTQLYLYEYDAGGIVTRCPRHICPYAVVEYTFRHLTINQSAEENLQTSVVKQTPLQLDLWEGKLYSDQQFISSVVLRSSFLKLQLIEFTDYLRISSSITTIKLCDDYLADFPCLHPCKEIYKARTGGHGLNYVTCFQLIGGSKTGRGSTAELKEFISELLRKKKAAVVEIKDAKAFLLPQCNLTRKKNLPVFNDIESKTSLHVIMMSPSTMAVKHDIMRIRAEVLNNLTVKQITKNKLHWRPMENKIEKLFSDFGRVNSEPRFMPSCETLCNAFKHQRLSDYAVEETVSKESPKTAHSDEGTCTKPERFGLEFTVDPKRAKESMLDDTYERSSSSCQSRRSIEVDAFLDENKCRSQPKSPQFNGRNINTHSTFFGGVDGPDAYSSEDNLLNNLLQLSRQTSEHELCRVSAEKQLVTANLVSDAKMTSVEEQVEKIHDATDNVQLVDMMLCSPSSDFEKIEDVVSIKNGLSSKASPLLSPPIECPPLPPPQQSPPLPPLPQLPPPEDEQNVGVIQATNTIGACISARQASSPCHRRKRTAQDNDNLSNHHQQVPNKLPCVGQGEIQYHPSSSPVSPSDPSENIASIPKQCLPNSGSVHPMKQSFLGTVPQSQLSKASYHPLLLQYPEAVPSVAACLDASRQLSLPLSSNVFGSQPPWTNNAKCQTAINHQSQKTFPILASSQVHGGFVPTSAPQNAFHSAEAISPPIYPSGHLPLYPSRLPPLYPSIPPLLYPLMPPPFLWAYRQPFHPSTQFSPPSRCSNTVSVSSHIQPAEEALTNNDIKAHLGCCHATNNGSQIQPKSCMTPETEKTSSSPCNRSPHSHFPVASATSSRSNTAYSSNANTQQENISQSQCVESHPVATTEKNAKGNLAGNQSGKLKTLSLDSSSKAVINIPSCPRACMPIAKLINGVHNEDSIPKTADTLEETENDKQLNCGIVQLKKIVMNMEEFRSLPFKDRLRYIKKLITEIQKTLPNLMEFMSEELRFGIPTVSEEANEQFDIVDTQLAPLLEFMQTLRKENYVDSK